MSPAPLLWQRPPPEVVLDQRGVELLPPSQTQVSGHTSPASDRLPVCPSAADSGTSRESAHNEGIATLRLRMRKRDYFALSRDLWEGLSQI